MRKLKQKKGFTLIEMLACVVTLLLIGMIVSAGLNLATMSLREVTFETDSQTLRSTMDMYIGDILRHATDVKDNDDKAHQGATDLVVSDIMFTNDAYYIDGGAFAIDLSVSDISGAGYLMCTSTLADEPKGVMVANKGTYAGTLFIKDFTLTFDASKGVFTGSYTIVSSATDTTKLCEFSYRTIAN